MRKAFLSALVLLLLVGCGKKVHMYIMGYVERTKAWGNTEFTGNYSGNIWSDPVLTELTVTINDKSMEVEIPHAGEAGAYFWDDDSIPIPPVVDSEYAFDIKTDVGNVTGTCTMPGDFEITSHDHGDTVAVGPVTISWEASTGGDWYQVRFSFYDTMYDYKDTVIFSDSATTITTPAGFIDMDGWFTIWIDAGAGPKIGPEAAGNFKGANGFLVATNRLAIQLVAGSPTMAAPKNMLCVNTPQERIKTLLKELSKYNDDAAEMLELMK